MNLNTHETDLVFSIMRDLSGDFDHAQVRQRVGSRLLELLNAEYFASFVWDQDANKFLSCVQINMCLDNLSRYEAYYQFHDPITPMLQRRRKATPVSQVLSHKRLVKTEFFNDFLKQDGLCYGINYFAYDRGTNIGDVRVWRGKSAEDFSARDAMIIDAIGPSFVNALIRAHKLDETLPALRFSQISAQLQLTNREVEIADMLVVGFTDNEICQKLCFSKSTLRTHIGSIFRKSDLNRRTQLSQFLADQVNLLH
ncbi:helix-turn-helix transcriptional regulator [Granulosicoccus antarcticus]|uniref:HTH luxR-type domain-containing protein n=1 Tax=Granulosicoccus antarcticus IMCC3135 TaxID=1192854 RepID=A0A2Z2NTM3_9GAMM|nr:LuxR C-terminal-related transcriptional regulator [Granulosicoccus antarcticus]ASJ73401.1 hypothetical protein IMCC3135_16595 [Granulosicoccus antarcticus IMCC3135]